MYLSLEPEVPHIPCNVQLIVGCCRRIQILTSTDKLPRERYFAANCMAQCHHHSLGIYNCALIMQRSPGCGECSTEGTQCRVPVGGRSIYRWQAHRMHRQNSSMMPQQLPWLKDRSSEGCIIEFKWGVAVKFQSKFSCGYFRFFSVLGPHNCSKKGTPIFDCLWSVRSFKGE